MQRLILTIIAAFVMAIVFGPVVIPWLRRMKFGQTIYDLGPQSHKKKQGIPTMGGVIFAPAGPDRGAGLRAERHPAGTFCSSP